MKSIHALIGSLFFAVVSYGQSIFSENFNYFDGQLTTVSEGVWANHSGTGTFIQVNNQAISLTSGSGSREDVNASLGSSFSSGMLFAGIDLTVTGSISSNDYFFHFKDIGTGFRGRVFVLPPTESGFLLGIDNDSSAGSVLWNADLALGETYRIVLGYDTATTQTSLWVDPVNQSSTNITDSVLGSAVAITSIAFRQGGGTIGTQTIDNLVVSQDFATAAAIPEASTYALLAGILSLGLVIYRRK